MFVIFFKPITSVRGGHSDCSPRASRSPTTPLREYS